MAQTQSPWMSSFRGLLLIPTCLALNALIFIVFYNSSGSAPNFASESEIIQTHQFQYSASDHPLNVSISTLQIRHKVTLEHRNPPPLPSFGKIWVLCFVLLLVLFSLFCGFSLLPIADVMGVPKLIVLFLFGYWENIGEWHMNHMVSSWAFSNIMLFAHPQSMKRRNKFKSHFPTYISIWINGLGSFR